MAGYIKGSPTLLVDADIDPAAAIAESKLDLDYPTHSSVNDPSADQKAALAGTSGTAPSGANKLVDNADARLSNARTPVAHYHAPADVTGTAVVTTDARLADARTPTAHGIAAAKHSGFGANDGTYLREDGAWAAPPGTGGEVIPTGTGFVHITNGTKDAAAKLIGVADLAAALQQLLVPSGLIAMHKGTIATIPAGWYLCDGTNGTPDLRDKFIVGARQDDAGVAKTNVSGALTQTGGSEDIADHAALAWRSASRRSRATTVGSFSQ
jgi:hypothetical protein